MLFYFQDEIASKRSTHMTWVSEHNKPNRRFIYVSFKQIRIRSFVAELLLKKRLHIDTSGGILNQKKSKCHADKSSQQVATIAAERIHILIGYSVWCLQHSAFGSRNTRKIQTDLATGRIFFKIYIFTCNGPNVQSIRPFVNVVTVVVTSLPSADRQAAKTQPPRSPHTQPAKC